MMTNNHFIELWSNLEKQNQHGLFKVAYSSDIPYKIYATVSCPDKIVGIAISFCNHINIDIKPFQDLRQLSVERVIDNSFKDSSLLIIQLRDRENRDVFSTLCENLVISAIQANNESSMISTAISKLYEWKMLFDKMSQGRLSKLQQQGLFGELYYLDKILSNNKLATARDVVSTWHGMEKDKLVRDFQGDNWVVEVKTTTSNRPQKVTINGERQLDDTLINNLFLFHCSVDISNVQGITLPQMIQSVQDKLSQSYIAYSIFEEKLYQAGYFNKDVDYYLDNHYLIRNTVFYKVSGDFPRIRESELRNGVGDVHYSIVLDSCQQYEIADTNVYSIINII